MSARPGPKPRAGETASAQLHLRVTVGELAAYRAAARSQGLSLSAWVRSAQVRIAELTEALQAALAYSADAANRVNGEDVLDECRRVLEGRPK